MSDDSFFNKLKQKVHSFIMKTYDVTENFPKSELYGATNQLRRAAVSIMLNFVEGFGRRKPKTKLNFFETSYGSLRECKYLIYMAFERKWVSKEEYNEMFELVDESGAMLWSIIKGLEKQIDE